MSWPTPVLVVHPQNIKDLLSATFECVGNPDCTFRPFVAKQKYVHHFWNQHAFHLKTLFFSVIYRPAWSQHYVLSRLSSTIFFAATRRLKPFLYINFLTVSVLILSFAWRPILYLFLCVADCPLDYFLLIVQAYALLLLILCMVFRCLLSLENFQWSYRFVEPFAPWIY